jgi:hypothetical protein
MDISPNLHIGSFLSHFYIKTVSSSKSACGQYPAQIRRICSFLLQVFIVTGKDAMLLSVKVNRYTVLIKAMAN